MKKSTAYLAAILLAFAFTTSAYANPGGEEEDLATLKKSATTAVTQAQWDLFSKNLVDALRSEHDGVQHAAMRYVIQYDEHVDVKDAVFDVMRIYRDGDDLNARRMALVTLGHMDSAWAISFLELSEDYESSVTLRQTIRAVVAEYHANNV